MICGLVEDLIRGLSGRLGVVVRRVWYRRRLRRCGSRLLIEPGVHIVNPGWISLGDHVWLDRNVVLIAGFPRSLETCTIHNTPGSSTSIGEIRLGNNCHVGIGTVIQGHGGVQAGDYFTTSPHAKIYSLSNDHRKCRQGTINGNGATTYYRLTPVVIGSNVWLGMNTVVIGHTIGSDTFLLPGTILSSNISENSIVEGNPGKIVAQRFPQ